MTGAPAGATRDRVPAHLRAYVVEQDYDAYTALDHEVWRFVLVQLRRHLAETAHPAYLEGLARTGMSIERIPRIEEMDACLRRYGWGAVGVDGFIPPRAFQEFQALSLLPIAVDIRTVEHLPYTPAPDILHEAAGHAPILPDPQYARFLQRIGAVGMRAFGSAHDAAVYQAVHDLSVVKERRDATEAEVRASEERLADLVRVEPPASEAARLARLYWWTVEYGLVGTPQDYRLYGAGLLSSLGESHFCHRPEVRKLPLDAGCADLGYDITRPQPQLFVARDFAHLDEVLDAVSEGFAFRQGGREGLAVAHASGEVATVELDTGMHVTGEVTSLDEAGGRLRSVSFSGRCLVAERRSTGDRRIYTDGYTLALARGAEEVTSVRAGSADATYWAATPFPDTRAPARIQPASPEHGTLLALHGEVRAARLAGGATPELCARVHATLSRDHPHAWLLRWNLLELAKRDPSSHALCERLAGELRALEAHYGGRYPVATGLRDLGYDPS